MAYHKNALQQETQHRLRLTPEEKAIIDLHRENNGNKKALHEARVKGGKARAAQRLVEVEINRGVVDVPRGAILVPQSEAQPPNEMQEGDVRDWTVTELHGKRIGIISDVHVPFHDVRIVDGKFEGAYITALEYLKAQDIDCLLINGDFMDIYNLSKHEKIEQKRNFVWELDVTRQMLKHLREYFGDIRIVYKEGNHEERWGAYVARKADQLQGLFTLADLLKLRDMNIEWIGERNRIAAGALWIDHGHEWFGGGGVNPARNYRMKANDNIMVGHVHKTSSDMFTKPLNKQTIAGWSVGCLCDLNPLYAPRNNWNHGFAIVELDGHKFTVHNKIIENGVVR